MEQIFIVTATNFEYNDEIHSVGEIGGDPVVAFSSEQDAIDDANQRTVSEFLLGWAGDELGSFGWEMNQIFKKKPPFVKMDEEDFMDMETYSINEYLAISDLSADELKELAESLAFKPYAVTEVAFMQEVS